MQLVEFLQTSLQKLATNPDYMRSSKRTDDLHDVLLSEILEKNPQWRDLDWRFEYKLRQDGFGGTFDIDIAGFEGADMFNHGSLKVAILAKAINSNVNKNIKNYANTTIGEAARLCYAPHIQDSLEKVLFISVLPREAPRFNNQGDVTGLDDVCDAKLRTNVKDVLAQQYGDKVEVIDRFYTISDVKQKQTKSDFNDIIVERLDPLLVA